MAGEHVATSPHAAHDAAIASVPTASFGVVVGILLRGPIAHAVPEFVSLRNAAESLFAILDVILEQTSTTRYRED